ncbi:pyridoxal phosphate-dependent deaminase, putative [Hydrogenimonas sp.]|nr:pyridoxal phosphate-dependent deaminase, putative [Hydrogenimonas sp.]
MIETDLSFRASDVEPFRWRGLDFFVKRDELIDPRFSGNKLRKLYSLFKIESGSVEKVVSYGGSQSNAMLSIAYLCAMKGWRFVYYSKKLPSWLQRAPSGNLERSLELGMDLRQLPASNFYESIGRIREELGEKELFVPQGGADPMAGAGVKLLAEEIMEWAEREGYESFSVATPSGTGTTALYLREALPERVEVVTTPVVGDEEILKAQWRKLAPGAASLPKILFTFGKHPFARPHPLFYETWRSLKESGIEFDLIYAPKMWIELQRAYDRLRKPLLYVHSGGVSGNVSQLHQYSFRGIK